MRQRSRGGTELKLEKFQGTRYKLQKLQTIYDYPPPLKIRQSREQLDSSAICTQVPWRERDNGTISPVGRRFFLERSNSAVALPLFQTLGWTMIHSLWRGALVALSMASATRATRTCALPGERKQGYRSSEVPAAVLSLSSAVKSSSPLIRRRARTNVAKWRASSVRRF